MDKATSVLAALEAGKLPSHEQVADFIDWLNQTIVPQVAPGGDDQLSAQGRIVADDLRQLLNAYKQLGSNKNYDNLLQEYLWHLSQADLSSTSTHVVGSGEASKDAKNVGQSFATLLRVLWSSLITESSFLAADFLSFARLALADAAEVIEGRAKHAKEGLREVEGEVQAGERTSIGRKKSTVEEERQDIKKRWEHGMDTAKDAGSSVIGAGQEVAATAAKTAEKASAKIRNAYYEICDRAQKDQDYHDALTTIFDIIQKWLNRTFDTAQDINKSTSLESFIDDPTPEQHLLKALRGFGKLLERLSGGKSLDALFSKLRTCVADVRQDETLRRWMNDFFAYLRQSLDEPGYARSDQAKSVRSSLSDRWHNLKDPQSAARRKWHQDWDAFKREWEQFIERIADDEDLRRIQQAHVKLADDLEVGLGEVARLSSMQAESMRMQVGGAVRDVMQQVAWFWTDVFKVYLPRALDVMKDVPIPRTEYQDSEIEFVLENVELSSFKINPAHIFIRNITDIDVSTTSTTSTTAVGSLTRVHIQAMQLQLKDVSFWYKDKGSTLGPSSVSGLVTFTMPAKGVDIDFALRTLPSSSPERSKLQSVIRLEKVEVGIADDVELSVKESNHPVLLTMFKPIFILRFKAALEKVLEEWVRGSLEWVGKTMYDVGNRRVVFEDAGIPGGRAFVAAIWSEIGRIKREDYGGGKVLATGTGIVIEKEAEKGEMRAQFAVGAEPQILSGEKRGPLGTASQPLKERLEESMGEAEEGVEAARRRAEGVGEAAKREVREVKEGVREAVEEGRERVQSFRAAVQRKRREEEKRSGWQSAAFDMQV